MWLERWRDVSAQHAFVLMESRACRALGKAFVKERDSEAVEQLRRAVAVVQSSTGEIEAIDPGSLNRPYLERAAMRDLVDVLGRAAQFEEADALFLRLREGADNSADCMLWEQLLRGSLALSRDNREEAAEAWQAALDVARQHPRVLEDEHASATLQEADVLLAVYGPRNLMEIMERLPEAIHASDWRAVLAWESRLEDVLAAVTALKQISLLRDFAWANSLGGKKARAALLSERQAQLQGKLERFSDQGMTWCTIGGYCTCLQDLEGAGRWFQKARELGAQHGLMGVECEACLGLGRVQQKKGRTHEAGELFRHACTVLDFVDVSQCEVLESHVARSLLETDGFEAAGPLIQKLRARGEAVVDLSRPHCGRGVESMLALAFTVHLQARRGGVEQAARAMKVLPISRSLSPFLFRWRARISDPPLSLHLKSRNEVAKQTLVF